MGLFDLFSRKHRKIEEVIQEGRSPVSHRKEGKRALRLNSKEERLNYIKDNCEIIRDSERQIGESKAEYQLVTSYLTDIQKIELIPLEERGPLEKAANNIVSLSKERTKLQNKSSVISDRQYRIFEQYELQLPKEMQAMKESEEYQAVIEQDIKHLEKERKKLKYEQEDIISKQAFLKGMAIIICFIIVFLFTLFVALSNFSEANYTIPFLLTVVMGMICAYYIFTEARKNLAQIQLVQMKQNRQIMLMNKVKIKSVNNLNYLEYSYNKYIVTNYEQLQKLWYEFVKVKEEMQKYQRNTNELDINNNELISELKKYGVADAEIWIYQPTAILDNKEMVEVRHRLNVRRQKIRERIDLNISQKDDAMKCIKKTLRNYPDCIQESETVLRQYRIILED